MTGVDHPDAEFPRLAPAVAAHHHLLLLADDVDADEVEALVTSIVVDSRWTTPATASMPGVLDLLPDVTDRHARATLTGPWSVAAARGALGLPAWSATAFVVDVDPDRSVAAPPLPHGYGPLLDAFGTHHPQGLERQVLDVVHACARRLAGALRVTGGAVIEPDPDSAVDMSVHAPLWLDPDALAHVLAPALPGVEVLLGVEETLARGEELDGYGASWATGGPEGDHVLIEVEAAEVMAPTLRFLPWTSGGVISYHLRWLEGGEPTPDGTSRAALRRRREARRAIARAALALMAAVDGAVLDEDGFLLDPDQLAADLRD